MCCFAHVLSFPYYPALKLQAFSYVKQQNQVKFQQFLVFSKLLANIAKNCENYARNNQQYFLQKIIFHCLPYFKRFLCFLKNRLSAMQLFIVHAFLASYLFLHKLNYFFRASGAAVGRVAVHLHLGGLRGHPRPRDFLRHWLAHQQRRHHLWVS